MKSVPSFLVILTYSLVAFHQVTANVRLARFPLRDFQSHWLADSHSNRHDGVFKRWFRQKPAGLSAEERSLSSSFDGLQTTQQFKGRLVCVISIVLS
jgi:hypothetical protein